MSVFPVSSRSSFWLPLTFFTVDNAKVGSTGLKTSGESKLARVPRSGVAMARLGGLVGLVTVLALILGTSGVFWLGLAWEGLEQVARGDLEAERADRRA